MATAREIAFDNVVAPGAEYTKSARFKEDLYNAGTPGEAKAQTGFFDRLSDRIVNRRFTKFGPDGSKAGETSLGVEIGWIAANFAAVQKDLADIKAALRDIKKAS